MPESAAPPPDRRTQRTLSALTNAMIDLLLERGWDAIGIRELCERADIARSTFYLHFKNKEEVLNSGFAALRFQIRHAAPHTSLAQTGKFGFIEGFAAHIFENRKLFRALTTAPSSTIVRERFQALLSELIIEELENAGIIDAPLAHFLGGGMLNSAAHLLAKSTTSRASLVEELHRLTSLVLAEKIAKPPSQ